MKPLAFTASLVVVAAALLPACNAGLLSVGHEADAGHQTNGEGASSCASAGGTCVLGDVQCATEAPQSAQDCNTNPPNPGGAFCCLDVPADAGPPKDSGGASSCASAGGTCVLGDVQCATEAPQSAQDCNTNPPNPGGAFCCLALPADAGPPKDSGGGGSSCASAGGSCVIGDVPCVTEAPQSAQDCNTNPPNPGGAFCCLVLEGPDQ
jgi:hypothetical protein